MKVQFTAKTQTSTESYVVTKFSTSLVDSRTGDSVAGEIFLTTSVGNAPVAIGESVAIELVPGEEVTEPIA